MVHDAILKIIDNLDHIHRSDSLTNALSYITAMLGGGMGGSQGQATYYLRQYWIEWVCCAVASVPVLPWLQQRLGTRTSVHILGKVGAWCIFLYAYIKLVTGSFNPFIYFHF